MSFVRTGYSPIDRQHWVLERCLRDLATAVRARDTAEAHGRTLLLSESLGEHFADEEDLMRSRGWSALARHAEAHAHILVRVKRFERYLAVTPLTPELASWALRGLPEMLRFHSLVSDFGFGKFALGLAFDPGRGRNRLLPVRSG